MAPYRQPSFFLPNACLASLLVHVLVAMIFSHFPKLTVAIPQAKQVLSVTVNLAETAGRHSGEEEAHQPRPALVGARASVRANTKISAGRGENLAGARRNRIAGQSSMRPEPNGGALGHESIPWSELDDVEQLRDGLREYRLNLARLARRFKRYPGLAEANAWEGIVLVAVNSGGGGFAPLVSLRQSSGHEVLDAHALEMLGQAVTFASLPVSLRGRQFAFVLPVHFLLNE